MKNLVDKERIVVTDTISDMLTRIRNATMVKKHQIVQIPYKNVFSYCRYLEEEGFIEDLKVIKNNVIFIAFIKIYW
jgi:ribosomal protein S8